VGDVHSASKEKSRFMKNSQSGCISVKMIELCATSNWRGVLVPVKIGKTQNTLARVNKVWQIVV